MLTPNLKVHGWVEKSEASFLTRGKKCTKPKKSKHFSHMHKGRQNLLVGVKENPYKISDTLVRQRRSKSNGERNLRIRWTGYQNALRSGCMF